MFLWWIVILVVFVGLLSGLSVWGIVLVLTLSMLAVLATLGGVDRRRHHRPYGTSFYHPPTDTHQPDSR